MDHTAVVTQKAKDILSNIGFGEEVAVSSHFDADSDLYQVLLETKEPGQLIGYHGENLSAFQLILGQHLHSKLDSWVNLSVNVNDYRERREQTLHALADSAVVKVLETGLPHSLPPMPAGERRIVHLYLAQHPQVQTSSEGLGRSRCLVISPRNIDEK